LYLWGSGTLGDIRFILFKNKNIFKNNPSDNADMSNEKELKIPP